MSIDTTHEGNVARLRALLDTLYDSTTGTLKTQTGAVSGTATLTTNDILPGPKAWPIGHLQYESISLNAGGGSPVQHIPSSLGADGNLYGMNTASTGGRTQIWTSADSLNTAPTYGVNLATLTGADALLAGEFVTGVTKTWDGWLIAVGGPNTGSTSGGAYFSSTSISAGFSRVLTSALPMGRLPMKFHHGKSRQAAYYYLGEYSGNFGTASKLYQSRTGQAWIVSDTLTVVDSTTANTHYHAVCIDEYGGRHWVSNGDGDNRGMKYSESCGQPGTWVTVADPPTKVWSPPNPASPAHTIAWGQPTLMIPTDAGIVIGPDDNLPASLQLMVRDNTSKTLTETFDAKYLHTINFRQASFNTFSYQPYARRTDEIYFTSNRNAAVGEIVMVGSGDGGRSWHNVGSLRFPTGTSVTMNEGVVGIDANGYMFVFIGLDATPFIARFKALDWRFQ